MTVTAEPVEGEIVEPTTLSIRPARAVSEWEPQLAEDALSRAVAQVRMRERFMREVMRPDFDYGVIPGTGKKPTLLKPGAERLLSAYGLHAALEDEDEPVANFETGVFVYRRRCKVYRQTGPGEGDRILVAQASGVCSSFEDKYRYRWQWDEAQRRKVKAPNPNPADILNTILKMADKRALVAAAIIATGWSDVVTQDMEDAAGPADAPRSAAAPRPRPATTMPANGPTPATYPAGAITELGRCPKCRGFFFEKTNRDGEKFYQCKGKPNGAWCNTNADEDAVRQYLAGLVDEDEPDGAGDYDAGGDVDPDDVPF